MECPIKRAGRRVFLSVEAGFNLAFGDRLNPFYHLGAIGFFLFWVVAASGLYLYAFFDTSVSGAYASVEHLTHGQWWLGGVLRSAHRYASDAMVITMLLHLARHFCFDRHRGFRWFSWISGVVVLWLVYASGINGFMLPWDRLAQFVVVATAEWLDWLPVFNGALIRNFIFQASVNDRLFSLLAFMHIGIPLLLLLFLWVHIQRVPKASTMPPRAIWSGLLVTLLALALVVPVVSHQAADLSRVPDDLRFDWFYLGTLPVLYRWSGTVLWAGLAGLTLLLVVLPWLPPLREDKRGFRVTVHPGNRDLSVRGSESLLDGGLRAGLPMPYECRSGGCGVCKASVLNGEVAMTPYQRSALSDAERAAGKVLLCCAQPRSDVEIEYREMGAAEDAQPRTLTVTVAAMQRLADDVMHLTLRLADGERLAFRAGQYLNVLLDDGQRRAFSFANPPREDPSIELHVRRIPGGRFTSHVFTDMRVGDTLRIEGPFGDFILRESERPILFVAGATGFAPVKSMLEDAFARGLRRPMALYWGVRRRADLYMAELPERWAREHANFRFVPVLSDVTSDDAWDGRTGLVHAAILQDYPDLSGQELYACGSVKMVETAAPAFIAHGLREDACFSDAFFAGAHEVGAAQSQR